MRCDLAALAEAGSAMLIKAMATDRWREVRARMLGVLADGDLLAERAVTQQLDATCATLVGLPDGAEERRALAIGLRMMLRARLERRPEGAAELAGLLGQPHPAATPAV